MTTTIQVHPNGTKISISNNKVSWIYPGGRKETYSIAEKWIQDFRCCYHCGKVLEIEIFIRSLWNLSKSLCSTECHHKDIKKRFACCDKAEFTNCVCMYSFYCPDHGAIHIGTHD